MIDPYTHIRSALIAQAEKLERDADMLYASLLAPSMAERAMREDARALRAQAMPPVTDALHAIADAMGLPR